MRVLSVNPFRHLSVLFWGGRKWTKKKEEDDKYPENKGMSVLHAQQVNCAILFDPFRMYLHAHQAGAAGK